MYDFIIYCLAKIFAFLHIYKHLYKWPVNKLAGSLQNHKNLTRLFSSLQHICCSYNWLTNCEMFCVNSNIVIDFEYNQNHFNNKQFVFSTLLSCPSIVHDTRHFLNFDDTETNFNYGILVLPSYNNIMSL